MAKSLALVTALAMTALVVTSCGKKSVADEHTFRAEVYTDLNKLDKAEREIQLAIGSDASYSEAWRIYGNLWAKKGNADSAIAMYAKATTTGPDNFEAFVALSNAYAAVNKIDSAISAIRKAVEIKPDSSLGYNNLGVLLTNAQSFSDATKAFQTAITKDSANVQAHYNLGNVLFKQNRLDEAVVSFKKALNLNVNFTQCYLELANIDDRMNRKAEAANNRGLAAMTTNNVAAARDAFASSVSIDPNYAVGYNNLAHAQLKLNAREEAIENFKKAARLGYADAQRLLTAEKISWN